MRKRYFWRNRAITLGDRSDWQLEQELSYRREQRERVYVDDRPPLTRIYSASRYVEPFRSVIWVSVVSCESEVNQLQGIEYSVDDSTSSGLVAAIATLTALTEACGILYYCDDPKLPNPVEQPAPPAEFDNENGMLWDILLELIAERNVWKW